MSATGIFLYNTLSRQKEELVLRREGEVSLYVCGVTPYDKLHIGHARAFMTYDVLRRFFENRGLKVRHIQNVTDIDDKIIKRANEVGRDPFELATSFSNEALVELGQLDVRPAHEYPTVTGNIQPIIVMVKELEAKGYAYARGGDVYFDVSKDEDYGKLSGQKVEELTAGVRIDPTEHKDDAADFALWKGAKEGEPYWDSPWGHGRPGWHIECSAMSLGLLGEGFDIHGGARELVFPHHENEVAQSESFLGDGHTFAKTWWHCGVLLVDGKKMSKSEGNFVTVADALKIAPKNVWRMLFLQTHPRNDLDYTQPALQQARSSLARFQNALGDLPAAPAEPSEAATAFLNRFDAALSDDLNTPIAFTAAFEAVSEFNRTGDASLGHAIRSSLESIGFSFESEKAGDELTPKLIELLIEVRNEARERRDFKSSDTIRDRLKEVGVVLEDSPTGTKWKLG